MKKYLLFFVALLIIATASWAQTTQLLPFSGTTSITVSGINDNGMVVGYCENSSRGFYCI